ncbi:cell division protein FtsQ/DivIB [Phocicoccus pinnipedialis]|uniref:Cell division protein DivIB n=1 Tax=Phocicoccus pinnipedialis TaxID=110845 RepID=A0A6V7RHI5_9BACL|nr:cell division protein FtsQ/DivIB [Jeotgalicoccus pinnipedialis]MBP1939039.1 cell division protein FtsQ [Jeotgalicoccus pinnipedialis]CAD2077054.1 Cell division protein DivIB [Jeotgalicoccus pinnipedialis]
MKDKPNIDELKKKLRKKRSTEPTNIGHKETIEESDSTLSSGDSEAIQQKPEDNNYLDESVVEHYKDNNDDSVDKDSDSIELNDEIETIEVTELTAAREEDSEPKREKEVKQRNAKRSINYFKLAIILFTATTVFLVVSYLISSKSNVKDIVIEGNEHLTDEEILGRSEIKEEDKMYLTNTGKAEQNISLLPIVESIEVERDFPNTVNIIVKEYDVVAYVESKGRYYPVLENEQVLRGFDMTPIDAPIIHFFDGVEFEGMVKSLNQMNPQILAMISEIFYRPNNETNSRIQLYMNDGQEIIADYNTIGDKIDYYAGIKKEIGNKKGILDLEVSNTFLPYISEEVVRIKQNMRNIPSQVPYLEEIESSLEKIKRSLKALEIDNKE